MNKADEEITAVLAKYGEPFGTSVWKVQGTTVIYHKALERIAGKAGIRFDAPTIIRAERDEAVILVTGRMGDLTEWSIGEALVNVNYRVSGKQAGYVWAISEKRAKDRVILKLIGLHGLVYSEEEADEFKEEKPKASDARARSGPVKAPPLIQQMGPQPSEADPAPPIPLATVKAGLLDKVTKAPTMWKLDDILQKDNIRGAMARLQREDRGAWDEVQRAIAQRRTDLTPPMDDELPDYDGELEYDGERDIDNLPEAFA